MVCVCVRARVCACVYTCVSTCAHVNVCACVCTNVCMHISARGVCAHVHIIVHVPRGSWLSSGFFCDFFFCYAQMKAKETL